MEANDKTRVPPQSPIVEDEQGQLIAKRGISREVIAELSKVKGEPDWMRDMRLKAYRQFMKRPMPSWGGDMSEIYFDNIYYYIKPTNKQVDAWDELPESVKNTYEKLGIPEAERKYLAGVTAQYESEVVYHKNREDLEAQGVIFTDTDTALPELCRYRVLREDSATIALVRLRQRRLTSWLRFTPTA